jgi:hypothetical protein
MAALRPSVFQGLAGREWRLGPPELRIELGDPLARSQPLLRHWSTESPLCWQLNRVVVKSSKKIGSSLGGPNIAS